MSVATSTSLVTVEEYLKSTAKPNAEYIDGVVRPKPMPTYKHAKMESRLLRLIDRFEGFEAVPELTVKLRERKYLVPDVAVQRSEELQEPYPEKAIYLCVEILSPEDRPLRVNRKVREILDFGVPYVWVIDPETLESDLHTTSGSRALEDGILKIEGTAIEVPLRALNED